MTQFIAFDDGIEVNGTTINSVIDGMGVFQSLGMKYLEEAGIEQFVPEENAWYSQQHWLDAFKRISEKVGPATLKRIGQKIPENAVFPPEVNNIQMGLRAIDVAYHINHRDGEGNILFNPEAAPPFKEGIGHYNVDESQTQDDRMVLECHNPYPCQFDMGIVEAMAKKFESSALIKHIDGGCRNQGAESCRIEVTW